MADSRSNVRKIFTVNRKTFFNPSAWIGYDALAGLNSTIADTVRTAFVLPKPPAEGAPVETFAESMKRQGLTEADIKNSIRSYRTFAILCCLLATVDFLYTLYLLCFHFSILGFLLGMATTALFLGQAFRFDFWLLQLKKRKLGVTFAEWRQHFLGQKGTKS